MNSEIIEKVFDECIKKTLDDKSDMGRLVNLAYRLYRHELLTKNGVDNFDEAYYRSFVETTSPLIEKLYEEQDEDGSLGQSIYRTSLFVGIMCVVSRVYDDLDAIFARDCIHAGLDAAHYLMTDKKDIKLLDLKDRYALLWAFTELSHTDIEIKNTYDHSLMAGMPQKMSRQKKYKIFTNELCRNLFDKTDEGKGYDFDLMIFAGITILLDMQDVFSDDAVRLTANCIFDFADEIVKNEFSAESLKKDILLLLAVMAKENILYKDSEIENSSDSQLIKVIEYNVINKKKMKLSNEEINEINNKIQMYLKAISVC
ncbi:hypothetical protein [Butyrivibrio sp. JL13D10]|uniref:hypothetical protein n=1 Tax=Butyrivibrio sp. JL13D10 TaxID=3236815 RepID=UPI0038B49919